MLLSNIATLGQMLSRRDTRAFLKRVNSMLAEDPAYSLRKVAAAVRTLLQNDKAIMLDNGQFYFNFTIPPIPSEAFITLLKATPRPTRVFSQHARLEKTAPATMCFAVTDACTYNCYYCSNDGKQRGRELTTAEWIAVAADVQDMHTPIIFFTGGEPLLRNDLEQLISCIDSRSVTYVLTTGCGLTEKRAAGLKRSGLYGIGISLNSSDPERDNEMRGVRDAFTTAVSAVKIAVREGFCTSIIAVVPREAVERRDLFKLFELARSLGVKEVILKEPTRTGRLFTTDKDIFFDDATKFRLLKIQREANRKLSGMKVSSEVHVADCNTLGCSAGIQHSYISAAGDLQPCDFVPLSFGNVRETPVRQLWSDMNAVLGKPKGRCLADEVSCKMKELGMDHFPVPKHDACRICSQLPHDDYPRFYKALQGE